MASTGFWPVKSRLKDVIDYAENPDKTIDKRFMDDDLWATLRYAENGRKTDQKMYVSAINCPKQRAYQCMMDFRILRMKKFIFVKVIGILFFVCVFIFHFFF